MNNLSVSLIYTLDDTRYLSECLSQFPRGTEVVLCLTEPTDDMVKLNCDNPIIDIEEGELNLRIAKYYYKTNNFSFSAARNFAKRHCTRDWILSIDADERLLYLKSDFDYLPEMPLDVGGVNCLVISASPTVINENQLHLTMSWQTRLFRNKAQFYYRNSCHERIDDSILYYNYKIAPSDIMIKHIGYLTTKKNMADKMYRNLDLLMKDVSRDNKNNYLIDKTIQTLQAIREINNVSND